MPVAADNRVTVEVTEEQRPVTVARATEGGRLDMEEEHIRHQLLEGTDNNRDIVRLLGQMKILVIRRCVETCSINNLATLQGLFDLN